MEDSSQDEMFSDDSDLSNTPGSVTHFQDRNGKLVNFPSNYDPKTGEDLTISQAEKMNLGLTPVKIMTAPDGKDYAIKLNELDEASKLGLKPKEMIENEKLSKETDKYSGNIPGYSPSKLESFLGHAANTFGGNITPQVSGAAEGIDALLAGKDFTPAYKAGRDAEEAVLNAQDKSNPISAKLGDFTGLVGQSAFLPGGSLLKNTGVMATQGAENQGLEAANRGGGIGDIAAGAGLGGAEGAIGSLGGEALASLGRLGAKGIKNSAGLFMPKEAPALFEGARQGDDYLNKSFQEQNLQNTADAPKSIVVTFKSMRSNIGQQKGDTVKAIDSTDHTSLVDKMTSAINELERQKKLDSDPDFQISADRGLNRLRGNLKSLQNNPNNPEVIDRVKMNLGKDLFDNNGNKIIEDYGVRKLMDPAREESQQLLERASGPSSSDVPGYKDSTLGNINKGFKAIAEAQDPQTIWDEHYLNDSHIADIANGINMKPDTRRRLQNLRDLQQEISNNPDLDQGVKDELGNVLNRLDDISKKDKLTRAITESKGVPGLINRGAVISGNVARRASDLASATREKVSPVTNKIFDTMDTIANVPIIKPIVRNSKDFLSNASMPSGSTVGSAVSQVNGIPLYIYNMLGEGTKKLVQTDPDFAYRLKMSLPDDRKGQIEHLENNRKLLK